ncbi:uncharacterized protein DMAD_04550, partial [Drosophila madeirensis]
HPMFEVNIV